MLIIEKDRQEGGITASVRIKLPLIIVEDDLDFQFVIKSILEKEGYKLTFFSTAGAALDFINSGTDALMLLDYNLPDMSGEELINKLKERRLDIPFVIMTGMGSKSVAVEMMKLGALDYIEKDMSFRKMLPRIIVNSHERIQTAKKIRESEKALRASEEKYRLLAESTDDMIFILDLKGSFTYMNRSAMNMLGITPQENIKLNLHDVFPAKHRSVLLSCMNDNYSGFRSSGIYEIEVYNKDHSLIPVEMTTSPIIKNGILDSIQLSIRDISKRKHTEKMLLISEKKYFSLFNKMKEGVVIGSVIYDYSGNAVDCEINDANPAVEEFLGIPGDIIIGSKASEIMGTPNLPMMSEINSAIIENRHLHFDYAFEPLNKFFSFSIYGFSEGQFVAFFYDITEKMNAERSLKGSEEKYRSVIENASDGIFILDEPGNCIDINPVGCELLGYTREEAGRLNIKDYIPEEDFESFEKEYKEISKNDTYIAERRIKRKDGSIIPVEISTKVMPDGKTIGLVRNVSERKKSENLIKKMNIELEKKVFARTEQLRKTLEELKKEIEIRKEIEAELINAKDEISKALENEKNLSSLKSRFLNMISHEYRTPLTVINTSSYLLEKNLESSGNHSFTNHLDKIRVSVRVMTQLFEDVITIDKLESENYDKTVQPVDIVLLAGQIAGNMKYREKQGVNLKVHCSGNSLSIGTNTNLISLIITNLVTNAVKYNRENSPIEIDIEDLGEYVEIKVLDNGIGIGEKDMEHLFDPFHRGENIGLISGTGLGLTIVKKAVDILNGSIEINSCPNSGTEVILKLPK